VQAGAIFSDYIKVGIPVSDIESIDGYAIEKATSGGILDTIEDKEIEPDLVIGPEDKPVNLIEIKTKDQTYLTKIGFLTAQLKLEGENIVVYGDFPAIRAGLRGAIVELNGVEIKNQGELSEELSKYSSREKVRIKTELDNGDVLSYELELGESITTEGKAYLGIVSRKSEISSFSGIVSMFFINSLQDPSIKYKSKFNGGLAIFIRDLLWWIILINFFVALFNMLPAGFLDGGRFFYLTILGIVKNEKVAKMASKAMIYFILLILFLMLISWFLALIF